MRDIKNVVRLLAIGLILSFLLPVVKIGGVGFKPDLIFCALLLPFLFLQKKAPFLIKKLVLLCLFLFISISISNNVGIYYYSGNESFGFPSDFYQIFSRITAFMIFFYIAQNEIIEYDFFVKLLLYVFLLGLSFGILQFLNIGFINSISLNYYALTDTQMSGFMSDNFRGFGTAGNIITWGGLCCMIFYFSYFFCKSKYLRILICVLAVFNIFITASRASIIALVLSVLFLQFYESLVIKKAVGQFLKKTILVLIIGMVVVVIGWLISPERFDLLMIRFLKSEEDLTQSGRGAQLEFFNSFMETDIFNYVFGIGKPSLNNLGYMEMEPFFLLFAYGLIGIVLHYLVIYVIYRFVVQKGFIYKNISLFIIVTLVCNLIFSFGFFFFREAYSGMTYWSIIGFMCGILQIQNRRS